MGKFSNSYTAFVYGLEQINLAASQTPYQFVEDIEQTYKAEIANIVNYILNPENFCKVVMLAGPSSSGKTTTAYKIKDELKSRGKNAVIISLDDFYLGYEQAPVLKDGTRDYEAVEALDVARIKSCLSSLIKTGCCFVPVFDFKHKRPFDYGRYVNLQNGDVAIVEGIHALNPIFTNSIDQSELLKVYVSVKQGIEDYNGEILSKKDLRLIRRIVRDYKYRATDAENTFAMWDNVCRGEFLYIHPFKRTSDLTINSIHIYEPCVLCNSAIELLKSIKRDSLYFDFANKLLKELEKFCPIEPEFVPKDSLLREFLGDGTYSY